MLTIDPRPALRKDGVTDLMPIIGPRRFTSSNFRARSTGIVSSAPRYRIAALLTSPSSPPIRSSAAATAACQSSSDVTSRWWKDALVAELVRHGLSGVVLHVADQDGPTEVDDPSCDRLSEPLCPAGDEDALAVERGQVIHRCCHGSR